MPHPLSRRAFAAASLGALAVPTAIPFIRRAQAAPTEIRIDWATYNPVSLVLKEQGLLEKEFAADNISIRWVFSAGSNKALEYLNASSLDFGSTAGAAALIAKINSNPIKTIYVYSRPEWTALVTKGDNAIKNVADLKGQRVAVTRGTDPHIFLVRALAGAGLGAKDITMVLLQHQDGKLALERGDVVAWAGLDPLMAAAEIEGGARLFYRKPEANTWGVLNVRDDFAKENPVIVRRVLKAYEGGRKWALANTPALKTMMMGVTKLSDAVISRQLERTDMTSGQIGAPQAESIIAAGKALQEAGVLPATTDVTAITNAMIDPSFIRALAS
ncbi:MAG: aliphatic sulfonate ABC transporter substrate-binding protein [Acetobacteraceae bacterium]|nr:aliphatic sulfonate ABC transporter substrate-binding protein [Acetobacteraceae bacterium]MSP29168.1 aliphatic sulfonate ABC transporter substrate-binding protein [Acetobacteraceae bacterium]